MDKSRDQNQQPHDVLRLQEVLKRVMKERGLVYQDAAAFLGVSLPTVKRLLNRPDLSLAQASELAAWLGMSLRDLVNIAFDERPGAGPVTPEQEELLALNPHLCAYLGALMEGHSPATIAKRHGLSKASTERYLLALDKAKLVEYHGGGRVRLAVGRFLDVRQLPRLRQVFYEHFLDVAYEHFRSPSGAGAEAHKRLALLRLTQPTYLRLKAELEALHDKYLVTMKYETRLEREAALKDVTLVVLADLWKHKSFDDVIRDF